MAAAIAMGHNKIGKYFLYMFFSSFVNLFRRYAKGIADIKRRIERINRVGCIGFLRS